MRSMFHNSADTQDFRLGITLALSAATTAAIDEYFRRYVGGDSPPPLAGHDDGGHDGLPRCCRMPDDCQFIGDCPLGDGSADCCEGVAAFAVGDVVYLTCDHDLDCPMTVTGIYEDDGDVAVTYFDSDGDIRSRTEPAACFMLRAD